MNKNILDNVSLVFNGILSFLFTIIGLLIDIICKAISFAICIPCLFLLAISRFFIGSINIKQLDTFYNYAGNWKYYPLASYVIKVVKSVYSQK